MYIDMGAVKNWFNVIFNVVIMRAGHVVALVGTEDNGPRV